ncbi:hypothetical protein SmphiM6_90 [Sinorhizobium phage phiM6]|nr:hypothetical protein SmphiM6_90 [Sinorhizobium phage phiM6]
MARKYPTFRGGDVLVQVKNLPYERTLRWPHGVRVIEEGHENRNGFTPAWVCVEGLDANGNVIRWSSTWQYKRYFATHRIVNYRVDQEPMENEEVLG